MRDTAAEIGVEGRALHLRLLGVWALVLGGFVLLVPGQFADPFIRSDDFPALFGQEDRFWWKTLGEGRWLNWLWMARPVLFDPVVLFAIYMGTWIFAWTAVATAMTRHHRWPLATVPLAVAFTVMPHHTVIANWYNTLVPANLILCAMALAALHGNRRRAEWALALLTPPMLMCHTAYPFLMLGIVAGTTPASARLWDTARLVLVFCLALGGGLALIYSINWLVHGHFGIAVAEFRNPNPIQSLDDLLANLRVAVQGVADGIGRAFFGADPWVMVGCAVTALAILALPPEEHGRRNRLLVAFAIAIAVPIAHSLQSGLRWPGRALGVYWMIPVMFVALAMTSAPTRARRAIFGLGIVLVCIVGVLFWQLFWQKRAMLYQAESRRVAERIIALDPGGDAHILIGGLVDGMETGHELQTAYGFEQRLKLLTGLAAHLCEKQGPDYQVVQVASEKDAEAARGSTDPFIIEALRSYTRCQAHRDALPDLPVWPAEGSVARIAPGVIGLRLPDEPTARSVEIDRARAMKGTWLPSTGDAEGEVQPATPRPGGGLGVYD